MSSPLTDEQALAHAHAWLRFYGYTQWNDGTWQYNGYEVEADSLLREYIITEGKIPNE